MVSIQLCKLVLLIKTLISSAKSNGKNVLDTAAMSLIYRKTTRVPKLIPAVLHM